MAGEEREGAARQTHGEGEEHGIHRLGHEEVGDLLDVRDDASPLRHDARDRVEAPVDQHELGHGARRCGSGADGDADVALLQCEHVVDPVTRHGDHVAVGSQRPQDLALLLGCHPPEDGGVGDDAAELSLVVRQRAGIDDAV